MNRNPSNVQIPDELSKFFSDADFANYPKIVIPQIFHDDRGSISNLADGKLGDVAVIISKTGSVRANHVHSEDWHLTYIVYGQMNYKWREIDGDFHNHIIGDGELVYTPQNVPHRMEFIKDTCFIAISKLSRTKEKYELDTLRLDQTFFNELH